MSAAPWRTVALDSGAIIALSRGDRGAFALLKSLAQEKCVFVIPAPVLAEVLRGTRRDASVHRIIGTYSSKILPTDEPAARRAGALLGRTKTKPALTVDALIAATALEYGAKDILTADAADYRAIAGAELNVIPLAGK